MSVSVESKVIQTEQGMTLSGDFIFANIAAIEEQSNHYLDNNSDNSSIIFDCKDIQRLDSAGIALLVSWKRQYKDCRFQALPQQAQALIEAYHLKPLLDN